MGAGNSSALPSESARQRFTRKLQQRGVFTHHTALTVVHEVMEKRKSGARGYMLLQLDQPISHTTSNPPSFVSEIVNTLWDASRHDTTDAEIDLSRIIFERLIENIKTFGCNARRGELLEAIACVQNSTTEHQGGALSVPLLTLARALLEQPKQEYRPLVNARQILFLLFFSGIFIDSLPMFVLLRQHGLDLNQYYQTYNLSKLISFWTFFDQPNASNIEFLIRWLMSESSYQFLRWDRPATNDVVNDTSNETIADHARDVRRQWPNNEAAVIYAEIMGALELERNGSSYIPSSAATSSAVATPAPMPSSASTSTSPTRFRDFLQSQLDALPRRLLVSSLILHFRTDVLHYPHTIGYFEARSLTWMEQLIAAVEEAMTNGYPSPSSSSSSSYASSSSSSSAYSSSSPRVPIRLSEEDSNHWSLATCVLRSSTASLQLFDTHPIARGWLFDSLRSLPDSALGPTLEEESDQWVACRFHLYSFEQFEDFYHPSIHQCSADDMRQWLEVTRNTSDTLYPTRPHSFYQSLTASSSSSSSSSSPTSSFDLMQPESSINMQVKSMLEEEHKRWQTQVWPSIERELNEHLIVDLSMLVISYFTAAPPLSIIPTARPQTYM